MSSEQKISSSPVKGGEDSKTVSVPSFKYELMLRVIGQLQQGKSVQWNAINIPGKAKKTLSNTWVKVRAEINALEPPVGEANGASEVTTPVKTPKSAKKRLGKDEDDDQDDAAATGSPRKKGRGRPPVTPVKVQNEDFADCQPKVESDAANDEVE